jgi:FkbM family methyltransferase
LADGTTDALQVIDIGANIGDSARLILAAVSARILCVEGDNYWLPWLRANVQGESRVVVEPSLVVPRGWESHLVPKRGQGTTSFVRSTRTGAGDIPALTAVELRSRHPDFDHVRLIKSDTDGFDTVILPEVATEYASLAPVLFFEYDPGMAREVGADPRPQDIWSRLQGLGYEHFAYWSNHGQYLGHAEAATIADRSRDLELPLRVRGYHYWDVAAFKSDDGGYFSQVINAATSRILDWDRVEDAMTSAA